MSTKPFDGTTHERIAQLGQRVLEGGEVTRAEALWLFNLEASADIYDLLSWANRIREHYKGNKIHLCSIVNIKAGGCSENCRFCAQSAAYQTESPRYNLIESEPVLTAADEARSNGVVALGIVAAWRGLDDGPVLDQLCERLEELKRSGKARPDASLGIIRSQKVADRLRDAGLECYNHNLESSRRYFPEVCTTHSYEERLQTIRYLKQAGIKICSGGILGMGETRADRCDLAFSLKEVGAHVVPINILNPIPGTPFAQREPLAPLEILKSVACFRFILPRQEIMIAGGRAVNLRDFAEPNLHGRRQRDDGGQLPDDFEPTGGEGPADVKRPRAGPELGPARVLGPGSCSGEWLWLSGPANGGVGSSDGVNRSELRISAS
jgi:biotin synthase